MAIVVEHHKPTPTVGGGFAQLDRWIHVVRPTLLLPATTTEQLFRVYGGRILVKLLVGTVTTILDSTDPVLKVSGEALDDAGALIGTVLDVASTADINSLEVGGTIFVEGDGTAIVKANAGCTLIGTQQGEWIMPQGAIYITTGGTNLTGIVQWDLWYQPLDEGAYAQAVSAATAKV